MSDDQAPDALETPIPDELPAEKAHGEPAEPDGYATMDAEAAETDAAAPSFPETTGQAAALPTAPLAQPGAPVPTLSRGATTSRPGFRLHPASLIGGLLLIALGVIFLWPLFSGGFILVPAAILAITVLGIALGLVAHWAASGRQSRGALFIALMIMLWGGLTAIFALEPSSDVARGWPLYMITLGFATLLTFLGDRWRDRRMLAPGVILTTAGLIGLAITTGQVSTDLLDLARQAAPWVLIALALGLLPLAFRRVKV
jgi:hypothetical protein